MFDYKRIAIWAAVLVCACTAAQTEPGWSVDARPVFEEMDEEYCWFHPRAVAIPGGPAIMTLQKHLMSASDYYSGLYTMRSEDGGKTWSRPEARPTLGWRDEGEGVTWAVCDVTPGWHPPTGKALAIGIAVRYVNGKQAKAPSPRETAYAVYDPKEDAWGTWQILEMPDADLFYAVGAGCTQWTVDTDGTLLVPVYGWSSAQASECCAMATVLRCGFDGERMRYIAHGDELRLDVPRGFCEPSVVRHGGRYYLTLRNDVKGYVTRGEDGLHFEAPRPWTFDDGTELGSYNTQQHWFTLEDGLYLAYTRRGADNDEIFRHRAPLFAGRVDTDRLCVLRGTEQVVIPNRGATLGNFGVCQVSDREAWVTAGEGMFRKETCEKGGATGAVWVGRVTAAQAGL